MINISQLYCGDVVPPGDLRYGSRRSSPAGKARIRKPVVVWNCTARCNLFCKHCYSLSAAQAGEDELTATEAKSMIDDLGSFPAAVLMFSGGEPLLRRDIFELISHARSVGLRVVLSSNGTLITPETAQRLAESGTGYVGISIDGLRETNDAFRGSEGSFHAALGGVRNCLAAGLKTGLRMTMTLSNLEEIPGIFDLVERENIPRICFYHLVSVGRARSIPQGSLDHTETRAALDTIMDLTAALHRDGKDVQVLTVDNHSDGPYVYLRLVREDSDRSERCLELLKLNGGNCSGVGLGCVNWDGEVFPDQFWRTASLGNIRTRPFSSIWSDANHPLLSRLRDRKRYLNGRCLRCRFLNACNGNLRARAESATGDPWSEDPGCYLTDEEISQ